MALASVLLLQLILSFSYLFSLDCTFYRGYSSATPIISHFLIPAVSYQYLFHRQLSLLLPRSKATKSQQINNFLFLRDKKLSLLS